MLERTYMNWTIKIKFIDSFQNEESFPSCIALSFDGFLTLFSISNVFGLSITEETLFVEMRIWCIKIGKVKFYIWTPGSKKASAGGL
jgi:hypothetical protein